MASHKRAQRLKENHNLRAKAEVAAQFEDCVQAFQQLSDSLQGDQSNAELRIVSNDYGIQLKIWGDDSGASSRALDHALRSSLVIKKQTLGLLENLHSLLVQAIEEVRQNVIEESTKTTLPEPDDVAITYDDSAADDEDTGDDSELYVEEAGDVIGFLARLLPALQDPPQEDYQILVIHDADKYTENMYRNTARTIFPDVTARLVERLGYSNWRRHRRIWGSPDGPRAPHGQVNTRRAPFRSSPMPLGRQLPQNENVQRRNSGQLWDTAGSDHGTSTIVSHPETVLTQIRLPAEDSVTSVTGTSRTSSVLQHFDFVLPQPPVDLSTTKPFDCPYCRCELPLAFSSDDFGELEWKAHVYRDLKPYMCTFEDCSQEHQLYGNKDDWFQHELDCHRSQSVWSCGMCRTDFKTPYRLEAHLQSRHSDLASYQVDLIREHSKRYSLLRPLSEQPCAFCGSTCDNLYDLQSHLGNHLENFALATLRFEELQSKDGVENADLISDYLDGIDEVENDKDGMLLDAEDEEYASTLLDVAHSGADVSHETDASDPTGRDDFGNDTKRVPNGSSFRKTLDSFVNEQKRPLQPPVRYNVRERYENFVGREVDLQAIHKHLSTPGQICTISGRGGIGKSATAIEYLHRHMSEYPNVFWIEAESPGPCAESYGMIATQLKLAEKPLADEDARIYLVRERLIKSDERWLLVFDNVPRWSAISEYIPRNMARTKGSILVTKREAPRLAIPPRHPNYHLQRAVELDVLTAEQGQEFLLTSINPTLKDGDLRAHKEYELARKVVEVVGYLPLAISMIVGYVRVSRCTLADFLEMWEEKEHIDKKKKRIDIDIEEREFDPTIDSLWTIGIREVRMNSRRLLDVLSLLNPDTIPKSLLVGDHKEDYLEFLNSSETLSYKRMVNELKGRRLFEEKELPSGEPAYTIHRLLQQKILVDMEDYAFADAFRKAFRLIRKRFPAADSQQVPDQTNWDTCQEYIPHVDAFCKVYKKDFDLITSVPPKPEDLADLFYDAGFYVWARQTTAYDGLGFLYTAERILNKIEMGEISKTRADIHCVSGLILLNGGCLERVQGLKRLEEAWKIRKLIYEEHDNRDNDVLLRNAANDFSLALLNQHQFGEAGQLIKECRDRYQKWGTEEEHPWENSKFYGNYSIVLMFSGDINTAIDYQKRCLQLTEKFSGRKAMYYRRLYMLACLHLQSGDIQSALDKHLEVLTARLELFGRVNEYTILSTYTVGAMYHHIGNLSTATEYIKQCIDIVNMSTWDRVAFARAKYHLALLYMQQDIEPDAVSALEEDVTQVLKEYGSYAAECVHGDDDKLMILDDLQPTFVGRYTGRTLLKHLQTHLKL